MSKRSIINTNIDMISDTDVFVDRKNAIKLFDVKYSELQNKFAPYYVLYYWGVGGVGKSTLNDKLKDKIKNGSYISFNLDYSCNEAEILFNFRKQLDNNFKNVFKFPRFDYAVSAYFDITNNNYIMVDSSHDAGDNTNNAINSCASTAFEFATTFFVPFLKTPLSIGKSIFKSFKELHCFVKNNGIKTKYDDCFNIINDLYEKRSPSAIKKLLDNVVICFINDYNDSLNDNKDIFNKQPIVFALDTIEKFDLYENMQDYSKRSGWIFNSETGIINRLSSTMWVLFGRNRLYKNNVFEIEYADNNFYIQQNYDEPYMTDSSKKQILKDLSVTSIENFCITERKQKKYILSYELNCLNEEYTKEYLSFNGLHEQSLQNDIYKMSGGLPEYLDIYRLYYKNNNIDELNIKIDELVIRLLQDFSKDEQHIIYKMSTIENWTDEEMYDIMGVKLGNEEKIQYYRNIVSKSFIKKNNDERYIFNKTVSELIYNSQLYPRDEKNIVINAILDMFYKKIKYINYANISTYLKRCIDLSKKIIDINQLTKMLNIYKTIVEVNRIPLSMLYKNFFHSIYSEAQKFTDDKELLHPFIFEYAKELLSYDQRKKACDIFRDLYLYLNNTHGIEYRYTLDALTYYSLSKYGFTIIDTIMIHSPRNNIIDSKDDINIDYAFDLNSLYLGEDDYNTALLSEALFKLHYEKNEYCLALNKLKIAYNYKVNKYGENDPDTMLLKLDTDFMTSIANSSFDKIDDESLKSFFNKNNLHNVYLEIYRKSKELFGDDDLRTIIRQFDASIALYYIEDYSKSIIFAKEGLIKLYDIFGFSGKLSLEYTAFFEDLFDDPKYYSVFIELYNKIYIDSYNSMNVPKDLISIPYMTVNGVTKFAVSKLADLYHKNEQYNDEIITLNALLVKDSFFNIIACDINYDYILKILVACEKSDNFDYLSKYIKILYDISKKIYSEDNPKFQFAFKKLLDIYNINNNKLDIEKTDVQSSLLDLSKYFSSNGDYSRAIEYCLLVYSKRKDVLGEKDELTLNALRDLIHYYYCDKQYDKALQYHLIIYHIYMDLYNDNDVNLLWAINNLAIYYYYNNDFDNALKFGEEAYNKRRIVLSDDNPDTKKSLDNLILFRRKANKF